MNKNTHEKNYENDLSDDSTRRQSEKLALG